jgi:hypothetical protein
MKQTGNMDSISAYAERISAADEYQKMRQENQQVMVEINNKENTLDGLRKERDLLKSKCENQKS